MSTPAPEPSAPLPARAAPAAVDALAMVAGVPDWELTPLTRETLLSLIAEVDRLREEAVSLRQELAALEAIADADALAPILNRRAFLREAGRLLALAERYGLEPAVLYFDLNGFKAINDGFGHAAGDAVLLAAARILKANVRETDIVGRLGGDEFAICLASGGLTHAERKGKALVGLIQATAVMHEGRRLVFGASCGAYAPKRGESVEQALAAADARMYDAKRAVQPA